MKSLFRETLVGPRQNAVAGNAGVRNHLHIALGHMATDAIPSLRMVAGKAAGVALAAGRVVVIGRFRAMRNVMRIVTSSAG